MILEYPTGSITSPLYSDKLIRNNGVNYADKILDRSITSLY